MLMIDKKEAFSQYHCSFCEQDLYSVLFTPSVCMNCGSDDIQKLRHRNFVEGDGHSWVKAEK